MYPDPVRVISFGVSVEDLEKNPQGVAGVETSVEFCGGTHLQRSGHMVDFIITSEEAIAKGIRRIVALTGPEAEKARKKTALLEGELAKLQTRVEADTTGANSKDLVKQIIELTDDVSHATIAYVKKDEIRNILKQMKKTLDDKERAKTAAVSTVILEQAKQLCQDNPNAKYLVHVFEAYSNTKAIDTALKTVKTMNAETSAMFITVDAEAKKIFCMANVPKSAIEKGLKADEWVQELSELINGKGGGKPDSARTSGPNYDTVDKVLEMAKKFASSKLD